MPSCYLLGRHRSHPTRVTRHTHWHARSSGLAAPNLRVEIDAWAARAD